MNKIKWIMAGCTVWVALSLGNFAAAVPEIIELNGTLAWTTPDESVVGVQPFTVRLFDQLTGGTKLWEEHYNVEVDVTGRYGIQLGAGTQGEATNSLSTALELAGSAAFLEQEVRINGETRVFAPRSPLAVAPFAFMAGNAQQATQGFSVQDALKVEGPTVAYSIQAQTLVCDDILASRQTSLTNGALKCNTLSARTAGEPVVFSTDVVANKAIHVQGGTSVFSIRKPALTDTATGYQADTDCWLFLDPSTLKPQWDEVLRVIVGSLDYEFRLENYYPVPIPKGRVFSIEYKGQTLELNTDSTSPDVFSNGLYPGSYYMCLGVKP